MYLPTANGRTVFGQIRHFTPLFIADTRWNPFKYVSQLGRNGMPYVIKHIWNTF